MDDHVGRVSRWLAFAGCLLLTVACSATPKHIELAPMRADSYTCAKAKVVDLGLEIFEEDAEHNSFKALRRIIQFVDEGERISFDQIQVDADPAVEQDGELQITVTAGVLFRQAIGVTSEGGGVSMVDTDDQPPSPRGIGDARAIVEACSNQP